MKLNFQFLNFIFCENRFYWIFLIRIYFFAEAVNLELVNLNKHSTNGKNGNGLPLKKDTQVEIGDPYDEYFVPVNEHRKYMRYDSIKKKL